MIPFVVSVTIPNRVDLQPAAILVTDLDRALQPSERCVGIVTDGMRRARPISDVGVRVGTRFDPFVQLGPRAVLIVGFDILTVRFAVMHVALLGLAVGLWISAAGLAAFVLVLNQPRHTSLNNTRDLVAQAQAFRHPLYFYLQRPYSASFYSRGQAGVIADASALLGQSSNPPFSLAVKTEQLSRVPAEVARRIPVQRSFGDYTLLSPSVP